MGVLKKTNIFLLLLFIHFFIFFIFFLLLLIFFYITIDEDIIFIFKYKKNTITYKQTTQINK